ncbi:serine/threonine-protein kinase HipA [Natronocella acetinitrilica]|uniref:Serine/threonine-protein kinase HipA n=1 Tax=Natronocella acetinitrilica TaxID=414046 RepID=A0AAE3G2R5_9GAMM|nr:HipA domain-containing protein [Natronocella acetinitrilica]MCP1674357.1 serine/threonine-protein kinase HipA [Natronocella acetinitrilica]
MISRAPQEAYVWVYLPGASEPVVAGRIAVDDGVYRFNYGQSYLARPDAIALYLPELPLAPGVIDPPAGMVMAGSLRDAAPDAWGRRAILHRRFGAVGAEQDTGDVDELTYLLESGSDRIGALDFQASASEYVPRIEAPASLEDLLDAARHIEEGRDLPPELGRALHHGTSIGGARPKALVVDGEGQWIAKFASSSDITNVVKAEHVAMRLASAAGLAVAPVRLVASAGRDVLLVKRFDREPAGVTWSRRAMVSALTILGLDEMQARYASYGDLADQIRLRFTHPRETLHELFARMSFNVICGNTDDHARNHAAFWDGQALTLTPAYDICPQARTGNAASQAMAIDGADRRSRLATCLAAAPAFHLGEQAARQIIEAQLAAIESHWQAIADESALSQADRRALWERAIMNPSIFDGWQ